MLRVWDEISGKSTVVDGLIHFGHVHNVVFNPVTGELAAAGNEGAIRVWDPDTKNLRLYLPSRPHEVHGLAYSNDGKRLFTADDRGVSIWDATSGVRVLEFELASPPTCLDLSADGRVLAVADEAGNIHLWETP